MKNILAFIFSTVTLVLAADNYQTSFNSSLKDGKLQVADSILKEWSHATPDDPELFAARFNLLLNRAHSSKMVLSDEAAPKGDQLVLADTTGNPAGYLYNEVAWQDSLVDCAFAEIDRGIAAFPDRIDFRLGKATAASLAGRWNTVIDAIDALLDHDAENGGHWLENGNIAQANADTILPGSVFERLRDLYRSDSPAVIESALPMIDKASKRFDNDVKILNLAGGMNFYVGNTDAALAYFEKAASIAPDDALPLTNIGYIYYQQGDSAKALEIYRSIETGNYDENSRDIARQIIAEITSPVQSMPEYAYFFRYLPQIAGQVESPANFLDVEMINTHIPAYNKMRSPFADTNIKADDIPQQDGEPKIVVWTFPMPQQIPMCRYIAFVAEAKGGCKMLTLEKSLEDYWVIGTMTDSGSHSNFGDIPYPDNAAAFVKALRKKNLLK